MQACRNPGMLESRIPARCDICRQFWSYLKTNHVNMQTILSYDQNHVKKNGFLSEFHNLAFRGFCMPEYMYFPTFWANNTVNKLPRGASPALSGLSTLRHPLQPPTQSWNANLSKHYYSLFLKVPTLPLNCNKLIYWFTSQ